MARRTSSLLALRYFVISRVRYRRLINFANFNPVNQSKKATFSGGAAIWRCSRPSLMPLQTRKRTVSARKVLTKASIYQVNNMWSAWHHGTSYGAGRLEWFKENVTPSVFRYQKGQTTTS